MVNYQIDINVGYDCNFRCSYCFEKLGDKNYKNSKMSPEVISKACEYVNHLLETRFKNDRVNLCFYGGEPLLHMDIIEEYIIAFKDNERVIFDITTNGTLINTIIDKFI